MNVLKAYSAIKKAENYNCNEALREATKLIKEVARMCYDNSLDTRKYRVYEAIMDLSDALMSE